MSKELKVWQAYREFKELGRVVRGGLGSCGIYPWSPSYPTWQPDHPLPPESDLEHTAGMMKLARLISWYYPEVIGKALLDDFIFGAEIHEMGERTSGDILDDGTRNDAEKDALETKIIETYLNLAPEPERLRGIRIFGEMRDKTTEFGRTLYCLDKTEAILQAIFYERSGHPGRLDYKLKTFGSLSERDRHSIAAVNTDNISDCWAHAFAERAEREHFEHRAIFLGIIHAAIKETRGVPPK